MKKVFIFGAGASRGSQIGGSIDVTAPLINDLFDVEKYGTYAERIPGLEIEDLQEYHKGVMQNGSLEDWLTKTWEDIGKKKTVTAQKNSLKMFGNITYYIHSLMQAVSNSYNKSNGYRAFLRKLNKNEVDYGIINFNYDTLLDRALVDSGENLMGSLTSYTDANYIKPHGSVNWFLQKRPDDDNVNSKIGDDIARVRVASSNVYQIDKPIPLNLVVYPPSSRNLDNGLGTFCSDDFKYQYGYPLILIPLSAKLYDKHVANFRETIIDSAKSLVAEADTVYLIGYRANDAIIEEILGKIIPGVTKLVVVSNTAESADEIAKRVGEFQKNFSKIETIVGGFEGFINSYNCK